MTEEQRNPGAGEYDALPVALKEQTSVREWMWKTDAQKAAYVREQTEPEV